MPYINIRLGKNLEPYQHAELYKRTTELMDRVMGKRREVTVVHIQESPPHYWAKNAIALSPDDPAGVFVDIKVTRGTNTAGEKAEMLSQIVRMLKDVAGAVQEACYVVIDDIAADSWGYNGVTQAKRAAEKL